MKKVIIGILLTLFFYPTIVFANSIGPFLEDINVSVNCNKCNDENKEVIFQLDVDGEAIENKKIVLNKDNNYQGTFTELPIYKDKQFNRIKYEVKYLEGEEYVGISDDDITYEKGTITKWVQVLPEDIQEGHQYVLFTDNWNYENNGLPKHALLTWDMKLVESEAKADYQIIDGKQSFYSLTIEPDVNNIWTVTKVPESDPYDQFKDYLFFTNYKNKNITLTGYNMGDWINYIYKHSGKSDGYVESEDAYYTNKVELIPVENSNGRFMITSHNNINGVVRGTKYLGVDHFANIVAQAEPDYGAHLMLFEHVQEKEVTLAEKMIINTVLCENKINENPKTGVEDYAYVLFILPVVSIVSLRVIKKNKKFNMA